MTAVVGLLAGLRVLTHLVTSERYGYAADELYLLACSDRLAWGYLDAPPAAAHFALAVRIVLGSALLAVRLAPALAGGALVILTASLARRLGGDRYAALLAALCVALSPVLLAAGSNLGPNAYAPLAMTAFVHAWVGFVQSGSATAWFRLWLLGVVAVGLAPGAAVLVLAAPVVLLLSGDRARLGGFWFWLGGAVALAYLLPVLAWQAAHGWPVIPPPSPFEFAALGGLARELVASAHVVTAPLWIAGAMALLLAPRLRAARAIGVALVPLAVAAGFLRWDAAALVFVLPVLFAAGAVHFASVTRSRAFGWLRNGALVAIALAGIVSAPLVAPILPLTAVPAYAARAEPWAIWPLHPDVRGNMPERFADMLGWEERVAAIRRALDSVPPKDRRSAAIWARDRFDAAAIDRLGGRHGLARAVSADGDYALWGSGLQDPTFVIAVGFSAAEVQPLFRRQCRREVEECRSCPAARRQLEIHVCESPRAPSAVLWAELTPQLEPRAGIE